MSVADKIAKRAGRLVGLMTGGGHCDLCAGGISISWIAGGGGVLGKPRPIAK